MSYVRFPVEWVSEKVRKGYATVYEAPHKRRRLGLSEQAVQDALKPHTGQVDVQLPRLPEAFLRAVEARLGERRFIELPKEGEKWPRTP